LNQRAGLVIVKPAGSLAQMNDRVVAHYDLDAYWLRIEITDTRLNFAVA
jgi:hypothetical protein